MEIITKYRATDGKEFTDIQKCMDYENLIDRVNKVMQQLSPKPDLPGCSFENGHGYIQHDRETYLSVRNEILDIASESIDHHWIKQTKEGENVHASWVGRLLDEYNIKPLYKAWNRISCVDKLYREWGQPYFASNPHKGEQIQLN